MDDIIIKIENYKGKTISFVMPQDATIEMVQQTNGFDEYTSYIDRICIDARYPGIEKYIEEFYGTLDDGVMF